MRTQKLLAALLSSAMVLGTMAVPVLADGGVKTEADLTTAIAGVAQNGTVTLGSDIELTNVLTVNGGKNFTLDLGNHKLSRSGRILNLYDGFVTIKNGTLTGSQPINVYGSGDSSKSAGSYNSLKLESTVTVDNADYAVVLWEEQTQKKYAYGSEINIDGATLNGNVWVMGNIEQGNSVINLNGTTIQGLDNKTSDAVGVGLMGNATVNVDDVTISAPTGIEVAGGTLVVNSGTITGAYTETTEKTNGNGSTTSGAGIAVSPYGYSTPNVTIKGGTINGYSALYSTNVRNTTTNNNPTITVNNGELNGHFGIFNANGTVIVNGGNIYAKDVINNSYPQCIRGYNDSTTVVNDGYIETDEEGFGISLFKTASLTMTGGTITAYYSGVANNGSVNTHGPTTMNISGGSITSTHGTGIYHPGTGTLNISGNTIIKGAECGIEMRAGKLNMTDGSVTSTAEEGPNTVANGSGSTTVGAGIAVAQHTTKQPIDVKISGGSVAGIVGLYEKCPEKSPAYDIINIGVTGGTFTGSTAAVDIKDDAVATSITGGTFSSDPQAYVAKGYAAAKNGTYEVTAIANLSKAEFTNVLARATSDKPVTIKSAVKNGKYEQVTAMSINRGTDNATFTIKATGDTTGYTGGSFSLYNIANILSSNGNYDGEIVCGLIITDIPSGVTLTIE